VRGLIAGIVAGILPFSSAALAQGTLGSASPEAPFGWTGLYIGINAGESWGRVSNHLKVSSTGTPSSSAKVTADVDGPLGGGQLGYSWRSQRWVYGLEADFQGSDADGLITGCSQLNCATISYGLDWFATLRGRLGTSWSHASCSMAPAAWPGAMSAPIFVPYPCPRRLHLTILGRLPGIARRRLAGLLAAVWRWRSTRTGCCGPSIFMQT
jgi:hypothetical protein